MVVPNRRQGPEVLTPGIHSVGELSREDQLSNQRSRGL